MRLSKNLRSVLRGLALLLGCALCFTATLIHGQVSATGTITGTVSDPTGAAVPDASVTATNTATGMSRTVKTGAVGFYSIEVLEPGTYDVSITKEGFRKYIAQGVKLDPGMRLGLNATLTVGAVTSEITVTATAIKVETASGESAGTIGGTQVQELMLNGRNFLGLALLVPGVNSSTITGRSVGGGSLNNGGLTGETPISVNGLGREFNLYTVDGAYNMNTGNNININVTTPLDSIAEFRVMKDNYSARYGVMGGQIMLETKSGTNDFHGSAYEYLRNDALDANNYFAGGSKTPLKQNNWGFAFSGPIKKGKTYFFGNEEWRRIRSGLTLRGAMFPQAMRNGDFTNSPTLGTGGLKLDASSQAFMAQLHPGVNCVPDSTHINAACFDPNSLLIMQKFFPLPNNVQPGEFLNYINPGVEKVDQRNDTIRIDHRFSDKLALLARYSYERVVDTPPAATWTGNPASTESQTIKTTGFNNLIRVIYNVSPNTVNTFSAVQTHDKPRLKAFGTEAPSGNSIKYIFPLAEADSGRNRSPALNISGGWPGMGNVDVTASDGEVTFSDDITTVKSSHVISAGLLYIAGVKRQNTFDPTNGTANFSGAHTSDPAADFLLGLDSSFTQANAEPRGWFHYRQFEAYVQDDWKVKPRLTLNLGVRESYYSSDTVDGDGVTDFDQRLYDPAKAPGVNPDGSLMTDANLNPITKTGAPAVRYDGLVYIGGSVPRGIFTTPHLTLGPRVGFAWDVAGNGKTAVRGGYGITYTRIPFGIYGSLGNPPGVTVVTLLNGTMTNPGLGSPPTTIYTSGINVLGPPGEQFKPARVQTWSLTFERELVPNGVLSVAYVGTGGRNLQGGRDINFPLPVSAPSINNPDCLQPGQTVPSGGFNFDPCLNPGLVSSDYTRPFRGWSGMSASGASDYFGTSNYHSLQTGWKYRTKRGVTLTAAYTWGKTLTDVADRGFDGRNAGAGGQNSYNRKAEYGPPGWDRTHIFTASYVWELPFLKGRRDVLGQALGNWTLSGITVIESGFALAPGMSTATNGLASRPNCIGSAAGPKTLSNWFNTSAFVAPAFGFFGNCGNGLIRGPGENTWNVALFKTFPIKERAKLQFRAEFFNIWNHPNFAGVSTGLGSGNYGTVTTALEPRVIEFALRFEF